VFVLLVENVVRDCIPFLLLSSVVLVGFSFAMFGIFQYIHYEETIEDNANENECTTTMEAQFESPIDVMISLFFAMVGMFEPKVMFMCTMFRSYVCLGFLSLWLTSLLSYIHIHCISIHSNDCDVQYVNRNHGRYIRPSKKYTSTTTVDGKSKIH